jgi:acetyl esterase/lipase
LVKEFEMPSEEMRAFNEDARSRKALLSSDYDPVAMRAALAAPSAVAQSSRFEALGAGASLELRGPATSSRLLLYVAGGGFCFGPSDAHRLFADSVAASVGARAALVHHRLAPEAPYPAALEDVAASFHWAFEQTAPENIIAMADSSGAALALSAMMTLRACGGPLPGQAVFLSPLTDMAMTGASHVSNSDRDPLFGPEAIMHKARHYLQGANPTDWRASPHWGDLAGLPPMYICAGSTEVMRDDAVRLAAKVRDAGGRAELEIVEEAPHVFPLVAHLPEAAQTRASIAAFLRS